ncbi:MAG: hypothetical protein CMP76_16300 [Flavobacterium sp.]|uniref:P-loop NTPase fold protein n=1 Tax=Flavobacterium sp. TaxID=239 RepID=UPI000C62E556|nr:P-loop NTPase fold protein [Flavobacterium sp.]MBF04844.1 hypothetical protein [Flavobacterium sp.]|tara:strand:+ start:8811 stop:11990 length:3180 start_codon:yes stop_codon:yes gene_type:complete
MEDNSTTKDPYKFLTNQPLGEDLFENKSQDKIAEVISERVINEPEFKIIGIDGEWGSGKSNLVRLVEKKLESTHKFFVYDVWGHQEDEQRKSILVELTDFIKKEKGILKKGSKSIWENKLKFLLAKSKETTTINQPYLSVGFIFSLLSIVYIPTVNVFKDSMSDFFEIKKLFWKIVLVTFPILIVIGIYIWNVVKNWINNSGFWQAFKLSAEETFQVYTNKQKEETKIETISEDQPSVRDFQNWMEDIDKDLDKKIVIVFDNFDRLPRQHILNIWSSIHIFFAEKKYSNIRVIIPFDREHVQNAFKDLNGNDNKFGDDYVNKTFDIVFRITLPIMSNWKKFFGDQWKKAFNIYNEEEFQLVVQVYEFLNRRITPREIISFINEILTIKLLDINFKERYIAIFVLKKDEILKDPLKAVTDFKHILGGLTSFYNNDPDYAKQLTAIIYHIDVENAIEIIYRQELKEALIKNETEHFNSICDSDFIDSIFVSTISEIEVFENPIITLASISEGAKVSTQHLNQAWNLFYNKVSQREQAVNKLKIDDWQITLLKNISDNRYLSDMLEGYFNLIDDSNIEHYIDLIDDLCIDLKEERILGLITNHTISEKNYIKLIEYSGNDHDKYKLSTNYSSLDTYLSKLSIEEILKIKNTDALPRTYDFKKYKEVLKSNLNTFIDQNTLQSSNDVFIKIKEVSTKTGDLKDILDDSRIYRLHMNYATSDLPIINELIAMRIAKAENFNSSYQSHFQDVLSTNDENKAKKISSIILQYITYDDLLLKSKYFTDSQLYKQIILQLFADSALEKRADIMKLVKNYQEIKTSLLIEDNELLLELNKWKIDKTKLDVDELDDIFITDCIKNAELRIAKDFSEVFNRDFKDLDREGYETVFDGETDVHYKYFDQIDLQNLTQTSLDAFESKLVENLKKGHQITKERWRILEIYESNSNSLSIINSLKNIRDEVLNSKIALDLDMVKKLLPYFIKYDLLANQTDIFRLIIKNEFLSDSKFIDLLISNSDSVEKLYKSSTQSDKEGFRNLLNEKREDNPQFETLAKLLDVRKAKRKTEE